MATFNAPEFRKQLHRNPELSNQEEETALAIATQLQAFGLSPITKIGGHGIICVFEGTEEGETTLIRADFDAIQVKEKAEHNHASLNDGVMHGCGHDGHTTSLLSVAEQLSKYPPHKGKVILLFQPAEETGTGAKEMLADHNLSGLPVENVFAYHNLPGYPLHEVVVKKGTFACASTGISIELQGKTSHAAYPSRGISPVNEMIELINFLQDLPQKYADTFSLVTIVHAILGEEAFGVSAGSAKVMATLRSECNATFVDMQNQILDKINLMQQQSKLKIQYSWHEPFNAASNSNVHVEQLIQQAQKLDLSVTELDEPLRWSEDFAEFLLKSPGALFGIGSGIDHAELHNPDYDFPDQILTTASNLFLSLIESKHR
ncbi:amidohydrolase [Vibrio hannami]|uniref:amidohydrolase n=1 Tax=Vibrio hannami TaxID=2717094 RepID=UPI00240F4205|nr:amidohydrolase [Vibrio hannami]MDG3084917.1 amidohydrolase [Vibrio hannami]